MNNKQDFVRQDTLRDAIIFEIADLEWNMIKLMRSAQGYEMDSSEFQDFYQVRYSIHSAMNSDTLGFYKGDLNAAPQKGINLMQIKYAYMGNPAGYVIDPEIAPLVQQTKAAMMESLQRFASKYPNLADAGSAFGQTEAMIPMEIHITSELITKSAPTLQMLLRDVKANPDYIKDIYQTFISFFGQDSLEKVEVLTASQKMKACRGATL